MKDKVIIKTEDNLKVLPIESVAIDFIIGKLTQCIKVMAIDCKLHLDVPYKEKIEKIKDEYQTIPLEDIPVTIKTLYKLKLIMDFEDLNN